MKSIVQEGSSVAKAVEKALQIAGNPREFTVKVLEEPQKNFFGMTTRSAKIALLFDAKESEKTVKVEKPRTEHSKVEKPHPEKKQKQVQKQQEVQKKASPKVEKPAITQKPKEENQAFWTENMIGMVKQWIGSTVQAMDHAPIALETDVNRYYLRVTFTKPLHSNEEKERQIFRSFSYLILQSLRTKLQRPLRGFKIVLTRG